MLAQVWRRSESPTRSRQVATWPSGDLVTQPGQAHAKHTLEARIRRLSVGLRGISFLFTAYALLHSVASMSYHAFMPQALLQSISISMLSCYHLPSFPNPYLPRMHREICCTGILSITTNPIHSPHVYDST